MAAAWDQSEVLVGNARYALPQPRFLPSGPGATLRARPSVLRYVRQPGPDFLESSSAVIIGREVGAVTRRALERSSATLRLRWGGVPMETTVL